jgi:hypothetical protein
LSVPHCFRRKHGHMDNFSGSRFVKVKKETRIEEILDYSQGNTVRRLISPFPKGIRI